MSKVLSDEVVGEVSAQLANLGGAVQLLFFTQPYACGACHEQQQLLETLAGLSAKLTLAVYPPDSEEALHYGIDKAPATVVRSDVDYGIRFYGLTGGMSLPRCLRLYRRYRRGPPCCRPVSSHSRPCSRTPSISR